MTYYNNQFPEVMLLLETTILFLETTILTYWCNWPQDPINPQKVTNFISVITSQ